MKELCYRELCGPQEENKESKREIPQNLDI